MKLTRSQKISMGLLGVAVAAFLIDRAFFSPAAAGAAPVTEAGASVAGDTGSKGGASALPDANAVAEGLIASKLKSMTGVNLKQVRDAFAPSQAWSVAQRPVVARQERNAAGDFAATHRLSAVMASHNGGNAIVDGQLIRVGQKVGDWRLAVVTAQSAVFICGNAKATLLLPQR